MSTSRMPRTDTRRYALRRYLFPLAAALQLSCGAVFLFDALSELGNFGWHAWLEIVGVVALSLGATITLREYWHLLSRNRRVERALDLASGSFQTMLEEQFAAWSLTAAERDVALLSIKGVSVSDMATIRSSRDGTIKAQCAAIYRKAGVSVAPS